MKKPDDQHQKTNIKPTVKPERSDSDPAASINAGRNQGDNEAVKKVQTENNRGAQTNHIINRASDTTKYQAPKRPDLQDQIRSAATNNQHAQPERTRVAPANKNNYSRDATRLSSANNQTRIKQAQTSPSNANTPAGGEIRVLKNRFILEKVLGVGGMGVVYKAKDKLKVEAQDRDPYVAIKVLSEEFKTHPEAFIALQRESRKAQRIANPNTVKVYDFDRDGDVVFMTMEYMVGKPLDQLIKQYHSTGLPPDDAWNILIGMCSALIHAHNENIVHSDFKPGNVFVTESGVPKIFDFGIARAVANIDRTTGKMMDRTVFDAGSLGALTPAYASLEMLLGETPDTRDDIYALGCIAYEMLTGEHPYNRLPADEAYNKKLKPQRITSISKRQWKAIEKALAFRREDRISTVEEFLDLVTSKYKPSYFMAATLVILIGVSAIIYYKYYTPDAPANSQADMRSELEFEIRYNLFKEKIEGLLAKPVFSVQWELEIWRDINGMSELFHGEPDEWFLAAQNKTFRLYISEIRSNIKAENFDRAKTLLANASRYTSDTALLDNLKIALTDAIAEKQKIEQALAKVPTPSKKKQTGAVTAKKTKTHYFDVAYNNVSQQLQCRDRLNMRDFKIAITKLRELDYNRYLKLENNITTSLARCITIIGKTYPEQAIDAKRYASLLFRNSPQIAGIVITPRDTCDLSIAGLGARGDRAVCKDKIGKIGNGPALVVIPGNNRFKPFAIGKYEISTGELNLYCKTTKKCKPINTTDERMPATNISIQTISKYLKWLSVNTGKKYRLATKQEWVYAANSKSRTLDPNRNCQLETRGIQKGGELVRTVTGRQNSWGLVNYAGNAQELVYDKGRKLIAIGGSYQSTMDMCNVTTQVSHSGSGDKFTGFRVLREIAAK